MVVDAVYDLMDTNVFMLLSGIVLAVAGLQGVLYPDAWALAMQPLGQVFNLLPNVVHQALGGLIGFAGVSQVWQAVEEYM